MHYGFLFLGRYLEISAGGRTLEFQMNWGSVRSGFGNPLNLGTYLYLLLFLIGNLEIVNFLS